MSRNPLSSSEFVTGLQPNQRRCSGMHDQCAGQCLETCPYSAERMSMGMAAEWPVPGASSCLWCGVSFILEDQHRGRRRHCYQCLPSPPRQDRSSSSQPLTTEPTSHSDWPLQPLEVLAYVCLGLLSSLGALALYYFQAPGLYAGAAHGSYISMRQIWAGVGGLTIMHLCMPLMAPAWLTLRSLLMDATHGLSGGT